MFLTEISWLLLHPVTLHCDKQLAISVSKNDQFHTWMKYINICYYFVWDMAECSLISIHVRVLHFTNFLTVHQKNLNQIYFISGVLSDRYECYSKEYSCLANYSDTHACDNYYTNCT